jgi:hypothetical protein
MSRPAWRRAFQPATYFPTKVTPDGFVVDDERVPTLTGRVRKTHLVRKRFEDGVLACDSRDGVTARNGTQCEACLHPRCQPSLRLHLQNASAVYVIDLAVTAAQNFLRLEDVLEADGKTLDDTPLTLSVINRGYWGEVRFTRAE